MGGAALLAALLTREVGVLSGPVIPLVPHGTLPSALGVPGTPEMQQELLK